MVKATAPSRPALSESSIDAARLNRRALLAVPAALALEALLAACSLRGDDDAEDSTDTLDLDALEPAQLTLGPTRPPATFAPLQSPAALTPATPVTRATAHPRLWLRSDDLSRLRTWAVESNPLWSEGLGVLVSDALEEMDEGLVPGGADEDDGGRDWVEYPVEQYAELFAFTSLIHPHASQREDFAERARRLLMHVMSKAAEGVGEDRDYRGPEFSTRNRSRWWGASFSLTVDWIYPFLSDEDKRTIRKVFLRWCEENSVAEVTNNNHPEPIGLVNDPRLVADRVRRRWSLNNYYTAHMRNIGLMTLALDPADDPDGALSGYLEQAIGAWLYTVDGALREDARGGLTPEGFEYSPQSIGYVAQFLLALHTAGRDDPATFGPHVRTEAQPFWDELVLATLHSFSPATTTVDWYDETFEPAWFGDGGAYLAPDFIEVAGPLAMIDASLGNLGRYDALRWIQTHTPPGGVAMLLRRIGDATEFNAAILYFLMMDPTVPAPADPRPALPLSFVAPGIGHVFARTDWGRTAAWFTYALGWINVDHQHGDGNQFEFYRKGEWLTKERTGYGYNIASSEYHNTLSIENDPPANNDEDEYTHVLWKRGSQWLYVPSGDGQILALSLADDYTYAHGDATALYNSEYEGPTDVVHASRSIIWLKPDRIVVYDRAATNTDGRFKRFHLQLPAMPSVAGTQATMTTGRGQHLYITTLLPQDVRVESLAAEALEDGREPADYEPMQFRLRVEPNGGPRDVRFLHTLQGADDNVVADEAAVVRSEDGAFEGASFGRFVVLFRVTLSGPETIIAYTAPGAVTNHYVTGLTPGSRWTVETLPAGDGLRVTLQSSGESIADGGGVLSFRPGVG